MAELRIPPPTRIPLGSATVGGQRLDLFLTPEWARYFDSLNSQVVVTSNAVGQPGAPGTTGAAGFGVCMEGDGGSDDLCIPGPPGQPGPQGVPGAALFMLQETGEAAETILPATAQPEGVTAAVLVNSWVNYDTTTYNGAGFWRDAFGVVHLRGLVKSGIVGTGIFTLPAGYRPAKVETFAVNSNSAFGRVDVGADGNVVLTVGSNAFASLDGISFRAAGTY